VPLSADTDLALTASGVYRSAVPMQLSPTLGVTTVQYSSTYEIMNFSASLTHKPWRATLYVTNVFDKENILVPPTQFNELGKLTNDYVVSPPREVGIRLAYRF
jgi:outer membrane receptor protein involved in Fe transport